MRRLIALAMLLGLVLAPSAESAKRSTKVKFSSWEVRANGRVKTVEPGGTYVHCPGRHPGRIVVRGRMSRPSTKGKAVTVRFVVAHIPIYAYHGTTGDGGKLKGIIDGGGGPLPDGEWKAIARYDGKPVGKSRINVIGRQSACG